MLMTNLMILTLGIAASGLFPSALGQDQIDGLVEWNCDGSVKAREDLSGVGEICVERKVGVDQSQMITARRTARKVLRALKTHNVRVFVRIHLIVKITEGNSDSSPLQAANVTTALIETPLGGVSLALYRAKYKIDKIAGKKVYDMMIEYDHNRFNQWTWGHGATANEARVGLFMHEIVHGLGLSSGSLAIVAAAKNTDTLSLSAAYSMAFDNGHYAPVYNANGIDCTVQSGAKKYEEKGLFQTMNYCQRLALTKLGWDFAKPSKEPEEKTQIFDAVKGTERLIDQKQVVDALEGDHVYYMSDNDHFSWGGCSFWC